MSGEMLLYGKGDRVIVKRLYYSYWHRAAILRDWQIDFADHWTSYRIGMRPNVSPEELDEVRLPEKRKFVYKPVGSLL